MSGSCRSRTASTCWRPASRPRWASRWPDPISPGSAASPPRSRRRSGRSRARPRPTPSGPSADVTATWESAAERPCGGRYVDVDVDRRAAARYGLNIADVQQVVRTAIGCEEVTQSIEGLQRFPVNIRYPREWRDSPDALATLPIVTPSGAHIALGDVAKVRITDGPGMIRTENARLGGWVFVD